MLAGIFAALIFPGCAFAVEYFLKDNAYIINKPAVPYLVAAALNLILIRICITKDMDKTARGIMLTTFAVTLLLLKLKPHF